MTTKKEVLDVLERVEESIMYLLLTTGPTTGSYYITHKVWVEIEELKKKLKEGG